MQNAPRTELADYYAEVRAERAEERRFDLAEERGWIRTEEQEATATHQMTLEV